MKDYRKSADAFQLLTLAASFSLKHRGNLLNKEKNKREAIYYNGGFFMCGIVGYIGKTNDARDFLLNGLEKLEYRGYDSAGIALSNKDGIHIFKEKGRIVDLKKITNYSIESAVGIGQTRWATHGAPNKINAHPHQSISGQFTLVHNGVIENYELLYKEHLEGVDLKSDTDTEIVVHLIEKFKNDGYTTEKSFLKTLNLLKGSYAFALIDSKDSDKIYVAKNKSPLLIGLGDGTFNIFGSDALPMIHLTKSFLQLFDEEIVILEKEDVTIKNLNAEVMQRNPIEIELNIEDIEKGTYPHYMLKEIDEQPFVIRKILKEYKGNENGFSIDKEIINSVIESDRIYIIACGTSYNAGLIGKQYLENWSNIPVEVHIASEFSYNTPVLSSKPLFIFISQSGETADSRSVLKYIKQQNYRALTITNVQSSTLSREADHTLLLHAGPEIAVASTKAYTAQITVLSILAATVAKEKEITLDFNLMHDLGVVSNVIESICEEKEIMKRISKEYFSTTRNAFFIGRHLDYYVVLEGALKLKEISYIQAEGFAGGELKHGTIALIENNTPVIALNTQEKTNLSIRSNVTEVVTRGAIPCIISMEGLDTPEDRFIIPKVNKYLAPLVSVVPLQLISYYAALERDCDIDKPRNLAKSVTVE